MKTQLTVLFLIISSNLLGQDTIPPIFTSFWKTDTVVVPVYEKLFSQGPKVKAHDNVDGDVTDQILQSGSFRARFLDTSVTTEIGYFDLVYTVSDKAGNVTSKKIMVHVQDQLAPILIFAENRRDHRGDVGDSIVLFLPLNSSLDTAANLPYTLVDNYDDYSRLTVSIDQANSSQNTAVAGRHLFCYVVTDASLNSRTSHAHVCVGLDSAACFSLPRPSCGKFTVGKEKIAETAMSIYPNPSNGTIQISSQNRILTVRAFDLKGRLVAKTMGSSSLDIPAKGMFFIKVDSDNGSLWEKVVVE